MDAIELYGTLFYISMAVAAVGLGLAVFFFFYFDIPTVHALMTGKAKEETIRRMAEQNAKTGNLRKQHIYTGPTGRTGKTKSTGNTGPLTQNVAQPPAQKAPAPGQTDSLAVPERYETSVLQTPAQETTVLRDDVAQTQLLRQENMDAGATAVLSNAPAYTPAPQVSGGFRFVVTESTMVIHTDEII